MLFTKFVPHPVVEEIKSIDLNRLTALEAFDELRRLQAATIDEPNHAD